MLLPDEIKENERVDWYDPKMETFEKFLQEVESRKTSSLDPQMLVEPHDSVSNVSKQSNKSKCSEQSKQSATSSSISSAHLKIASERAARMSALRQKHAIEMEKNRLQAKLERMELETDIAPSEAKLKVLDSFHDGSEGQSAVHGNDAMNEYLDSYMQERNASVDEFEPSPVKFKEMRALPKMPLQRLLNRPHASEPAQNQEPQTQNHPESDSSEESSSSNQSINLLNVIQRQSDLADLLMLQHKQSSLPSRQIPVFDGDPLSFQTFICAFKYVLKIKLIVMKTDFITLNSTPVASPES